MSRFFLMLALLALVALPAISPLAQKAQPKETEPKEMPEDEEEEVEAETEADANNETTYDLTPKWAEGETYTCVANNLISVDTSGDNGPNPQVNTATAAIEFSVVKVDSESGAMLEYTIKVARAIGGSDRYSEDEEPKVKTKEWKLVDAEATFTRDSAEDDWSCDLTDRGGMSDSADKSDIEKAFRSFFEPFPLSLPSEATAAGGEWEPSSDALGDLLTHIIIWVGEIDEGSNMACTNTLYVGTGTLEGVETLVEEEDDGPREEDGDEESEEEEELEEQTLGLLTIEHDGVSEMSPEERVTLRFTLTGSEEITYDVTQSVPLSAAISLSGKLEGLRDGEVGMSATIAISHEIYFFKGDAETVIEENDLSDLFTPTDDDDDDDWDGRKDRAEGDSGKAEK